MTSRVTKSLALGIGSLVGATSIGLIGTANAAQAAPGVSLTQTMCTVEGGPATNYATPIDLVEQRTLHAENYDSTLADATADIDAGITEARELFRKKVQYRERKYQERIDRIKQNYATNVTMGMPRGEARSLRSKQVKKAKAQRDARIKKARIARTGTIKDLNADKAVIVKSLATPTAISDVTQRITGAGEVTVTWKAPEWFGDSIVNEYLIVADDSTPLGTATLSDPTITVSVPQGQQQEITITPVNENGNIGPSTSYVTTSPMDVTPQVEFTTLSTSGAHNFVLDLDNVNPDNTHTAWIDSATGSSCVLDLTAKKLTVTAPYFPGSTVASIQAQSDTAQPSINTFNYRNGIVPTVQNLTPTADGFWAFIMSTRTDATYTATVLGGSGTATFRDNMLFVTGVPAGQTRVVAVTESVPGGPSITINVAGTAISPAPVPNLSNTTAALDGTGFTFTIRNYSALPASGWSVTATHGTATIGTNGVVTVTGLTDGQSSTVTVISSVTGQSAAANVTGVASLAATDIITDTPTYTAAGRANLNVTNYDKFSELFVQPNSISDPNVTVTLDHQTGALQATNLPANTDVTFTIKGQISGGNTVLEKEITLHNVQIQEVIHISPITYLDDTTAQFTVTNWNDLVEGAHHFPSESDLHGAAVSVDWGTATVTVTNIPADTDVVVALRAQPDLNSPNMVIRKVVLRINS